MMASNSEEAVLDINSLSTFTIPKKKKAKKDLFEELSLDSRDCSDLLRLVRLTFKEKDGTQNFQYTRAQLIHNSELQNIYFERKKEMKQDGYSDKELSELYAFLCVDSARDVRELCEKGARVYNTKLTSLGNPEMGVSLCKHADVLKPAYFTSGTVGKLVVFKLIKGKMKTMTENHGGEPLDPTPGYDCHISRTSNVDISTASPTAAYESTQIYVFEYGDLGTEDRPRHVIPYAVLDFRYVGHTKVYRGPQKQAMASLGRGTIKGMGRGSRPPMLHTGKPTPPGVYGSVPSPRPCISPKSPRSGPGTPVPNENSAPPPSPRMVGKSVDGEGIVVWAGPLASKARQICDVELISYNSKMVKPARIGPSIAVTKRLSLSKVRSIYFQNVVTIPRKEECYSNGNFYHYTMMRPLQSKNPQFHSLVTALTKKECAGKVTLDDGTEILLLTNCDLTLGLGISQPNENPASLYCVFVSKHSRKGLQYITSAAQSSGSLSRSSSLDKLEKFTPPPRTPTPGSAVTLDKMSVASTFAAQFTVQESNLDQHRETPSPFRTIQPSPSPKSLPSPMGLDGGDGSLFKEPPEPTRVADGAPAVQNETLFDDGFKKFVPVSSLIYRDSIRQAFEDMALTQDKRNVELARRRGSSGSRGSRTGTPSPASSLASPGDSGKQTQRPGSGMRSSLPSPTTDSPTADISGLLGMKSEPRVSEGDHLLPPPPYSRPGQRLPTPRAMGQPPPPPGNQFSAGFPQHGPRPPEMPGRMRGPPPGFHGQHYGQAVMDQGFGQGPQSMGQLGSMPQHPPHPSAASHMHQYPPPASPGMQYPPAGGPPGRSQSQHSVNPHMTRPTGPHRSSSMPDMGSGSPLSALVNTVQNLTSQPQQIPGLGYDNYSEGPLPLVEPNVYPAPLQPQQQSQNSNLTQSLSVGTSPHTGDGTSLTPSGGTTSAPITGSSSTLIPGNNNNRVTGDLALPRTTEGLISTERGHEAREEQPYDPATELFPMEHSSRFSNSDHSDDSSDQEMMEDIVKLPGKNPWEESEDEEEDDDDEDDEDMDDDLINSIVKNQPLAAKAARATPKKEQATPVKAKTASKSQQGKVSPHEAPRKKTLKEILQMSEVSSPSKPRRSLSSDDQNKPGTDFKPPAPKEIPTEITPITEEEKQELEKRTTVTKSPSRAPDESAQATIPVNDPQKEVIPKEPPLKEVKDPPDKAEEKPQTISVVVSSDTYKKPLTPERAIVKSKSPKKSATACATRDPKQARRGKRTFKPQIKELQASPAKAQKIDPETPSKIPKREGGVKKHGIKSDRSERRIPTGIHTDFADSAFPSAEVPRTKTHILSSGIYPEIDCLTSSFAAEHSFHREIQNINTGMESDEEVYVFEVKPSGSSNKNPLSGSTAPAALGKPQDEDSNDDGGSFWDDCVPSEKDKEKELGTGTESKKPVSMADVTALFAGKGGDGNRVVTCGEDPRDVAVRYIPRKDDWKVSDTRLEGEALITESVSYIIHKKGGFLVTESQKEADRRDLCSYCLHFILPLRALHEKTYGAKPPVVTLSIGTTGSSDQVDLTGEDEISEPTFSFKPSTSKSSREKHSSSSSFKKPVEAPADKPAMGIFEKYLQRNKMAQPAKLVTSRFGSSKLGISSKRRSPVKPVKHVRKRSARDEEIYNSLKIPKKMKKVEVEVPKPEKIKIPIEDRQYFLKEYRLTNDLKILIKSLTTRNYRQNRYQPTKNQPTDHRYNVLNRGRRPSVPGRFRKVKFVRTNVKDVQTVKIAKDENWLKETPYQMPKDEVQKAQSQPLTSK